MTVAFLLGRHLGLDWRLEISDLGFHLGHVGLNQFHLLQDHVDVLDVLRVIPVLLRAKRGLLFAFAH